MEPKLDIQFGSQRMEMHNCVSVVMIKLPLHKKIFYKACEIVYWIFVISLGALSLTLFRMPLS